MLRQLAGYLHVHTSTCACICGEREALGLEPTTFYQTYTIYIYTTAEPICAYMHVPSTASNENGYWLHWPYLVNRLREVTLYQRQLSVVPQDYWQTVLNTLAIEGGKYHTNTGNICCTVCLSSGICIYVPSTTRTFTIYTCTVWGQGGGRGRGRGRGRERLTWQQWWGRQILVAVFLYHHLYHDLSGILMWSDHLLGWSKSREWNERRGACTSNRRLTKQIRRIVKACYMEQYLQYMDKRRLALHGYM